MTEERVLLRKVFINSKDASNIDATILNKLKSNVEGVCSADGFIKEIKEIINRTRGNIDINDLAGSIIYDVSYKADVSNVHINDIIVGAIIKLITPAGIFLEKDSYIRIFIPSDQINKSYEINDVLHVFVLGAECNIGKSNLTVVGKPHTYFIPNENQRMLIFPPHTANEQPEVKHHITNISSEIKNLCYYGYNPNIDELKNKIDEIDPNIWRFYRSLLNPTELVYAPSAYSTFNINPKNEIIPSRAYYKLWEIIQKFTDAFNAPKSQNILNLCENPAGFTKALIDFRKQPGDKYNIVSLKDGIKVSSPLLKKYGVSGPKTTKSNDSASKTQNQQVKTTDLDIIKSDSLKKLIAMYKKSPANIITADGGIKLPDGQFDEEREMGVLKFSEVVTALSCQEIGGTFVLKLFDSCSQLIVDLIYIIYNSYTDVSIYKPETSRPASSERYLIAINFKGVDKKLLESLYKIFDEKPVYISRIFDWKQLFPDKTFLNLIKTINQRLQNNQMKKIREMIEMILFYKLNRPPKDYVDHLIKLQEEIAKKWAVDNLI